MFKTIQKGGGIEVKVNFLLKGDFLFFVKCFILNFFLSNLVKFIPLFLHINFQRALVIIRISFLGFFSFANGENSEC
jgi:hypothetical protein